MILGMILTHDWRMCCDIYIYNIDVIIEFMWQGLEMGERRALASLSIRFVPSHIHSIFTVNM